MGKRGKTVDEKTRQKVIKLRKTYSVAYIAWHLDLSKGGVYKILRQAIKRRKREMQAYCMKCRTKREMKEAKSITMKNGRPATQGLCPTCGTKMFRIGKS